MMIHHDHRPSRGQTALEYLLLLAVVAVVVIASFTPGSFIDQLHNTSAGFYKSVTRVIMGENPHAVNGGWCGVTCPQGNASGNYGAHIMYGACECPAPAFGGANCPASANAVTCGAGKTCYGQKIECTDTQNCGTCPTGLECTSNGGCQCPADATGHRLSCQGGNTNCPGGAATCGPPAGSIPDATCTSCICASGFHYDQATNSCINYCPNTCTTLNADGTGCVGISCPDPEHQTCDPSFPAGQQCRCDIFTVWDQNLQSCQPCQANGSTCTAPNPDHTSCANVDCAAQYGYSYCDAAHNSCQCDEDPAHNFCTSWQNNRCVQVPCPACVPSTACGQNSCGEDSCGTLCGTNGGCDTTHTGNQCLDSSNHVITTPTRGVMGTCQTTCTSCQTWGGSTNGCQPTTPCLSAPDACGHNSCGQACGPNTDGSCSAGFDCRDGGGHVVTGSTTPGTCYSLCLPCQTWDNTLGGCVSKQACPGATLANPSGNADGCGTDNCSNTCGSGTCSASQRCTGINGGPGSCQPICGSCQIWDGTACVPTISCGSHTCGFDSCGTACGQLAGGCPTGDQCVTNGGPGDCACNPLTPCPVATPGYPACGTDSCGNVCGNGTCPANVYCSDPNGGPGLCNCTDDTCTVTAECGSNLGENHCGGCVGTPNTCAGNPSATSCDLYSSKCICGTCHPPAGCDDGQGGNLCCNINQGIDDCGNSCGIPPYQCVDGLQTCNATTHRCDCVPIGVCLTYNGTCGSNVQGWDQRCGTNGPPCYIAKTCDAGYLCSDPVSGLCEPPPTPCDPTTDTCNALDGNACGPAVVGTWQNCKTTCYKSVTCPQGDQCNASGECECQPLPGVCNLPANACGDTVIGSDSCGNICTKPQSCASGQACIGGQCTPCTGPIPGSCTQWSGCSTSNCQQTGYQTCTNATMPQCNGTSPIGQQIECTGDICPAGQACTNGTCSDCTAPINGACTSWSGCSTSSCGVIGYKSCLSATSPQCGGASFPTTPVECTGDLCYEGYHCVPGSGCVACTGAVPGVCNSWGPCSTSACGHSGTQECLDWTDGQCGGAPAPRSRVCTGDGGCAAGQGCVSNQCVACTGQINGTCTQWSDCSPNACGQTGQQTCEASTAPQCGGSSAVGQQRSCTGTGAVDATCSAWGPCNSGCGVAGTRSCTGTMTPAQCGGKDLDYSCIGTSCPIAAETCVGSQCQCPQGSCPSGDQCAPESCQGLTCGDLDNCHNPCTTNCVMRYTVSIVDYGDCASCSGICGVFNLAGNCGSQADCGGQTGCPINFSSCVQDPTSGTWNCGSCLAESSSITGPCPHGIDHIVSEQVISQSYAHCSSTNIGANTPGAATVDYTVVCK